jgi:GAF domain-containing protein/CheY-like chemotaxis protein
VSPGTSPDDSHADLVPDPGVLADVTRALAGVLDPAALAARVTQLALEDLGADAAALWLIEGDRGELVLAGHAGVSGPERVTRLALPAPGDVLGWLGEGPGPLVVDGLPAAARPAAREWLEAEGVSAALALALEAGGGALGALGLFRRGGRAFGRDDVRRAEAVAIPAAAAVVNARLYGAQRSRAERTEVLLATAEALGATLDLPAALHDLSERAAHALDAACTIVLWPGGRVPADVTPDEAQAARGGRPVEADSGGLIVPIVRTGDAIGVLRLTAPGRRRWERSAVDLAAGIAAQIALVAENSRLYREAQEQAGELAVLREIGATLNSTLDVPTVLDAVVDAAVRLSGAPQCGVLELDPTDQRLHVRAQRGFDEHWSSVSIALGQGAAGAAAQDRAPFFVGDLARDPLPMDEAGVGIGDASLREVNERSGRRAALAVPLISKDTVVGAIALFWRAPRTRDEREVRLLTGLAQQAAAAIAQARAHGASVRRAEELAALLRGVRTILGGLDTKTILERIVAEAAAIAGTPHVTLLLLEPDTATLRLAAAVGSPVPPDFALSMGESYSGQVATTGEPVFVADTQHDPRNPLARRDREAGIVSYLGLPVKKGDTVLGVLAFSTTAPRRYSDDELAYLGSFADHAAIAIDNGRLYEDAQRALSDLRAMQGRLVQGETLRALGELAGGAAHHLNNLLTIVVGRIQLVRRTAREPKLLRQLEIVERAAKDGAEVVRRLQQFAGMRRTAEPRTVNLNHIVKDVLEITRGRWQDSARAEGTEIHVAPRLAPLPEIPGDPAALREMLTNIVLNAVEALPGGGRLTVETSVAGRAAVVAVSDTGVGMPEDVRLRAHEPFFTTKGVKATGLGLSVAYGIARRHGGELSIESEVGHGATIRVILPLGSGPSPAPPRTPPAPGRALRVLLVDDEAEVRHALAEMLTTQGHAVVQVGSAIDALRRLEADAAFDLVLTDLVMPGLNGWELADAIKLRYPGLRVGVVTGWGDVPDTARAARPSVDFVLSKPLTLELIESVIGRAP